MSMCKDQILENFKESFPSMMELHLFKLIKNDAGIVKACVFVLLFKSELLQSKSSSMLTHDRWQR